MTRSIAKNYINYGKNEFSTKHHNCKMKANITFVKAFRPSYFFNTSMLNNKYQHFTNLTLVVVVVLLLARVEMGGGPVIF